MFAISFRHRRMNTYIFSMTLVVGLQLAVPDNKDIKKLIHYKPIIGGSKENKPITNQEFTKG